MSVDFAGRKVPTPRSRMTSWYRPVISHKPCTKVAARFENSEVLEPIKKDTK